MRQVSFVNDLSALGMSQPGICASILGCKCCPCPACSQELKFTADLAALEEVWGPKLGATAMSLRAYGYQVWIPYEEAVGGANGQPSAPPRPPHWEVRSLRYLHIEFPPRPVMHEKPRIMEPPLMMQQPGMMAHAGGMMQQQQQQSLQPQGERDPAWSREPAAWSPPQEQRPQEERASRAAARLLCGRLVRIRDLVQDAALNGMVGTIVEEPDEDGFTVVQLPDGQQRSFSTENLKVVKPRTAS